MIKHLIYVLKNPKNNSPFYIGCTTNLKRRIKEHFSPKKSCTRYSFIDSLRKEGLRPIVQEICFFYSKKEARNFEYYLTKDIGYLGYDLLNINSGNIPPTKKHRKYSQPREVVDKMIRTKTINGDFDRISSLFKEENEKRKIKIKDNLGNIYESMRDAERKTGCFRSSIKKVLLGVWKQTNGRSFYYA